MRPDALQILLDRMLSEDDLAALLEARHPDPFSVLGMHADADGDLWVRALLPGARSVALLDTATARRVGRLLTRHEAGCSKALIPRRRKPFDYRLVPPLATLFLVPA